ncbi:K02A2.6-like, partial [Cordylochernes scorpioides]
MVIGLKRAGWSISQIAADTHLGASTVHRLWRRWLEQGNVAIYRNAGATRVTSARVDRRILRQAVAAPQATCTAILQHVQDTLDHSISTRTISRRLVANGLHSCRPLRRLPLTPPNRRQRLEWCRARSTWMTEWHRVVFSDESRFCLSSDSRRVHVWRRRGERSNPAAIVERPTVRQRGIMVWGAIAYDSRSPLLRIQGTMTAQRYVDDVLRPVTLPYLQGVPNALYQQDNARPHTARISQQALQDVQMLPWPPYSPDLSPIEHVWDIIGRRLHALPQPRSEDELWQMVEREWRAIPQDAIRTLIDALPRRAAACIAVRDQEVKKKLLEDPQLTLPKAISVATIAESVCVQIASWEEKQAMIEKINKNTWEKNRSRVEKAKAGPSIANTRNECKWCGQQHTYGNCPAYRKTCNACGKLNHFAAVCRTRRIRNLIAENEGEESFEGGINVNKVLVKTVRSDKWSAVISINGNKTSVHLDTGAQINVLPQKVISLWPAKPIIKPTSLKAYAYGHSELPIVGKCEVLCQYGVGVINSECKMYTKPEYPPVRALPRRIPASLGNEVQSELEKMVKQGIITKIYHETEWSHPMVVVKKKSGQIRICLDPRKLNQALVRRHFQTPAPSELLHQIPKADYYTVLDVKSAYWHVPVANECRDLLVMATPFGKFRYNRLPFGLNISAQIFVEMMTNIFKNSFRNVTYVDDLLIYADSIEEHNEKLKGILEIARRNNIKFDLTKAQICKKEVSFLGHMISKNGIDPEPNKVDKVINLKKPEDKKSLQRVMGHTFIIQTDHQPLLPLIQKPLTDISPRLQRIVMKLFAFDFKLQYRPGKCLILADTLSRDTHPIDELPTPFLEDRRMVKLISANISDEKLITLQKDTREDTTLLKIIHYVIEGWPISKKDVDEDVKPYYDFRHRIYLWNELLCVGSAIVVPGTQINYMLELLHKSHQGISAIQGLARESLFWPGMSMDIAERVKSCDICQKYQKSKTRETLKSFPIPDYPWQTVSMDIFYIERKPHLLIVDRFSGYPEVYALNPPTATNVRNKLRETFARFGIPETIMSDNGPPFHSEIMTDFCTKWGIRQIFSSPHLHRSNGLAERNIQTIKTLLNKCKDQGSDAYLALLTYRNTPKNDLPSPAQL